MNHAAAVALIVVLSQQAEAQSLLEGRVFSVDSVGIAQAQVALTDSNKSVTLTAVTDSSGAFRIPVAQRVRPGTFFISVAAPGYVPVEGRRIVLGDVQRVLLMVALSPSVVVLEPVKVIAQRRYRASENEEFLDRAYWIKRTGLGHVLEREELKRMAGISFVQAVSRLPGVQWDHIENYAVPRMRDCVPEVFVDRIRQDYTDLGSILVDNLEGIEVYHGPEQVPPQYSIQAGTCGAIIAWTSMRVEDGRRLTPARAGLALGMALLLFGLARGTLR